MPQFKYRAYDRQGKQMTGTMHGDNVPAINTALSNQGYIPIAVTESGDLSGISINIFRQKVTLKDLMVFTRQMWTLQRAGVPIESSLSALREQADNEYFKKVLSMVIKDIQGGVSLSVAFSRHPDVFQPLFVNMVGAGEVSGKLDEVLLHLSEMCEFDLNTKEKIKAATRYPLITFVTLIIAFLVIVTFVIPRFMGMFATYGAQLPLPSRILLGINDAVRHHWLMLMLALATLVTLVRYYINTPSGRFYWDWMKIKIPIFGTLVFDLIMSRFTKILSELLSSGIPIIQSLQLVSDTIGNAVVRKAVLSIQQSVNEGKGMSDPMKRSGFFSPLVVQMVSVGEQSGKTDELLGHVASYYQEQANYLTKNLTTLIEPMLIFVIGGMVLLLALGVFLPMWNMTNIVH